MINQSQLTQHKSLLENHSLLVTDVIQSQADLQIFMEHHVFAVWDFMSLAKSLQHSICPSGNLWLPSRLQRSCSRLMNEIILSEESDTDPFTGKHISHFDLYCQAMAEVGADTGPIMRFIETVREHGIDYALTKSNIPESSRQFMTSTFAIIHRNQPSEIGAAFTHGRETVIPAMFRRIGYQLNLNHVNAPRFDYYLNRHVEVDGDDHGPAALSLLNELCEFDPIKLITAENVAVEAIKARIKFWDQVEETILRS
jgi:hypothetical protein